MVEGSVPLPFYPISREVLGKCIAREHNLHKPFAQTASQDQATKEAKRQTTRGKETQNVLVFRDKALCTI